MQRSMWICFFCLCALSSSARLQQQKLTKGTAKTRNQTPVLHPLYKRAAESHAFKAADGCFKALGLVAAEVSLETFAPSFHAAMKNPDPKTDPKFRGGTRGACLSMFAHAEWEPSDDLATHGGPYVTAIVDIFKSRIDELTMEDGVAALGKMYPYLDDGNQAVVLRILINVLKQLGGRPVSAAGWELKNILPRLPLFPNDLFSALKIAASRANTESSSRAMLGVAWAMQSAKVPARQWVVFGFGSQFNEVRDIVMAARNALDHGDPLFFTLAKEMGKLG